MTHIVVHQGEKISDMDKLVIDIKKNPRYRVQIGSGTQTTTINFFIFGENYVINLVNHMFNASHKSRMLTCSMNAFLQRVELFQQHILCNYSIIVS